MSLSKSLKRRVDNQNTVYKGEWKDNFAFILPGLTNVNPVCLICNEVVVVCKTLTYFFLFRSDAIILLRHFCRPEVQLKTTGEIKNANHGALVFSLISAKHQLA